MVDELEHKHEVKVQQREGRQKLPDDVKAILKGSGMMDEKGKLKLKGVSPKMLTNEARVCGLSCTKKGNPLYTVFCMPKFSK